MNSEGGCISVGRFKHCTDMREVFSSRIGSERDSSFDISNVGVMSNDGQGEWRAGRTIFSRSAFASGCVLPIAVVTGGDSCMVLGFTWQEGIVKAELVRSIIRSVEQEIERIVSW